MSNLKYNYFAERETTVSHGGPLQYSRSMLFQSTSTARKLSKWKPINGPFSELINFLSLYFNEYVIPFKFKTMRQKGKEKLVRIK